MKRKAGFLFILLTWGAPVCFAQNNGPASAGSIAGHVTDDGNRPLAGAVVYLLRLNSGGGYNADGIITGLTDTEGKYGFENLQTGDYKIPVRVSGNGSGKGPVVLFPRGNQASGCKSRESGSRLRSDGDRYPMCPGPGRLPGERACAGFCREAGSPHAPDLWTEHHNVGETEH